MTERQRFYTLQQLQKITGISRSQFYAEASRGKLVMRKAGGRTVVLAEDLDAWIATFEPIPAERAA